MATHDYVIANGTGAAVRSDINGALAAVVTNNSDTVSPATTYAYQWWADTTNGVMKLRNAANNAWITLFQLDGEWSTIALENGTAAAPSLYFKDSGTDTGVYSPGTDQVAISTGGTGRLFIDSSGRCGIGTTSPGALLELGTATPILRFSDTDTTGYHQIQASNTNFIINADPSNADANSTISFNVDGSERARIDSSGRLLVGTSSSRNDFFNGTTTVAGGIQLELSASDNLNRFMSFTSNNSDTGGACLVFGKSRGTSANSKTIVQADDGLAQLSFHGADGSDMVEAARIVAQVDGTPGANDMPGRLVFSTTADGASSPTERLRIANDGSISSVIPGGSTLYPRFGCRAWVNFNGTGVVAIRASGNVSSITDNGVGDYTVNFTTAMPDANYSLVVSSTYGSANGFAGTAPTTTAARVSAYTTTTGAALDSAYICVSVFR